MIHHYKNKKGFTLAEVLITLGIIGVVAALTIPTLIQNYKKREVETSLEKIYTTVNQAIKKQNLIMVIIILGNQDLMVKGLLKNILFLI